MNVRGRFLGTVIVLFFCIMCCMSFAAFALETGTYTLRKSIEEAFSKDKTFDPIKTGIVSVLGNIRIPAAYNFLIRLLEHESSHIVNWAGDALGKFNNVKALPVMIAANERIGGEKMIDAAIQKLEDLQDPYGGIRV